MAYLNNVWFENDIPMHGERGDICIESGYEKELLFARHCPPDGVYWLYCSKATSPHYPRGWELVRVGSERIGALRTLSYVFRGREENIEWYDFERANWRGPVELPSAPLDDPAGFAFRR